MRAGLLFRADKFSNSCLIHLYPMLTTHNASSAPICLIQGIEGKFYPVGKYGFSLYQVDESLMSFTDGIKRSILVSGDGIHIVPSEEIQQYLKNFVITQKSIGLDEPPAEFYFDTEIGASTLTGKRIMREGGRDVPLLEGLGYFALGERPLSAEMLPPALGTAFRYLEEAEAKTSSVPSLSGEADVPAQTTPISSASSSSSSSMEAHPIFRLNYCGHVPAQFGHEMQQGADIWSLGIILYEQMLRRGAEIPSAGLPSLDAIPPLYQNLMRESGLLPMFMLNPAEHHHEANLFGRLGEKKDDILPPTSTTSLVSPTNAITVNTSSGSSSVSATVAVHPDYNSMIDDFGRLFLGDRKLTSFDGFPNSMPKLEFLSLNGNQLSSLKGLPQKVPNLQTLFLDSNQLSSLEGFPEKMPNLEVLLLNGNQLSSLKGLPEEMPKLKSLYLNGNQLSSLEGLPEKMPKLDILSLKGNKDLKEKDIIAVSVKYPSASVDSDFGTYKAGQKQ